MLQNLKNIAVVSLSTVGSRLLGLLRDILIFAALGTSVWNSAFILAFTLPNLFRRLLGEGALTSALVPVFSDIPDEVLVEIAGYLQEVNVKKGETIIKIGSHDDRIFLIAEGRVHVYDAHLSIASRGQGEVFVQQNAGP